MNPDTIQNTQNSRDDIFRTASKVLITLPRSVDLYDRHDTSVEAVRDKKKTGEVWPRPLL